VGAGDADFWFLLGIASKLACLRQVNLAYEAESAVVGDSGGEVVGTVEIPKWETVEILTGVCRKYC
jgi:hypothetical protein